MIINKSHAFILPVILAAFVVSLIGLVLGALFAVTHKRKARGAGF